MLISPGITPARVVFNKYGFDPVDYFGADLRLLVKNDVTTMTLNSGNVDNWEDQSIYGNDVFQTTPGDQPLWNTTNIIVDNDGAGEFMFLNNMVAAALADSNGTIFFRMKDNDGAGINSTMFGYFGINNDNWLFLKFDTLNRPVMELRSGGGAAAVSQWTTGVPRSTLANYILIAKTAAYDLHIDGVSIGAPTSNNNGNWFNTAPLTQGFIGRWGVPAADFQPHDFAAFGYIRRDVTNQEANLLNTYLNNLP